MDGKYYKVLGGEAKSPCTLFDYTPYLPTENSAGAWLPRIDDAEMSGGGYYVSKYWNMWYDRGARIYEVDFEPCMSPRPPAVEDQICCRTIRLLRDVTDELLPLLTDEKFNIGEGNLGERNIGSHNIGERNTGRRNTGKLNSGDFNTGDRNTGIDNVGDCNVGSANAGSRNIGHSNTGDDNTGSYNSGHFNKGNANSGSFNTGNRNTGKWNVGSYHCGHFNTRSAPVYMFDKPTVIPLSQIILPKWLNTPNPKESLMDATAEDIKKTLSLPNFDFAIFEKITGITKAELLEKLG